MHISTWEHDDIHWLFVNVVGSCPNINVLTMRYKIGALGLLITTLLMAQQGLNERIYCHESEEYLITSSSTLNADIGHLSR
jgi:hypothetical protein